MKISIITVCRNAAGTIGDALASVAGQTWKDREHIVIDGQSTDGTLEMIDRFRDQVDILVSEPDRGIYDALNKGFRAATGEIIGLLHADDLFAHNDVLARVHGEMAAFSADLLYGDLRYVSRNDPGRVVRHWTAGPFRQDLLRKGWMPPHPALFMRSEVFRKHGPFRTGYAISADYDLVLRLFSDPSLRIRYLPEVLVKMRTGGDSNRSLRKILRKSAEDFAILRSHRLPFPLLTLIKKNLSKIPQFMKR